MNPKSESSIAFIPSPTQEWLDRVRLDKNIFYNLPDIQRSFKEDATLARDIIIFLAHSYKTDLFGYTNFSINDFCKLMKYKSPNLQKIHPLFESGALTPPTLLGHEFKSVFEYTLYRLAANNIPFSRVEKTQVPSMKELNVSFVQIISDIRVNYHINRSQKRLYSFKLGRGFVENLISFYVTLSLKDYLQVASNKNGGRIKNLYLYLAGMQHVLIFNNTHILTPNFDTLCEIAHIEDQLPKHRKYTLHKYLRIIAENSDLKFQIEFYVDKGQKQAYSIRLTFDMTQLQLEGNKKNLFFKLLNERLRQAFDDHFPQYIDNFELFQKWLTNRDYDKDLKDRIIRDVYKASFMAGHDKAEDLSLQALMEMYIKNLNEVQQSES
ncbi:hypothetical protein P1X15_29790 [Runella sp. MFBS21]|uniref:hypothetical protein n=1 Tax=Runella sp. MFBS21 TaxID=3034018 RepID=UPI0023F998AD|nr:hypothetical protein [Runella sp. MFBS21]MDF7821845.1 hypothetical protein [Runella sp. MFBS21]